MSWEILALALLGAAGWYWYAGMQARELAIQEGRRACQEARLQFLDETVAQSALRLARDGEGRLGIEREYSFEFSRTGAERETGQLTLRGGRVLWTRLGGDWRAARPLN